ncbi:hypothetical protein [Burkholderia sp. D-99]|uniref:hypothetical protein n=1 Tax=Burkholderia sp. D-99 TaxID=2717316 RepID=UPI001AA16791|nr:hypothetical protein [Burkholderia sp. D-99]
MSCRRSRASRFAPTIAANATSSSSSDITHDALHAAHEINGPTFAHEILSTDALVAAIRNVAASGGA